MSVNMNRERSNRLFISNLNNVLQSLLSPRNGSRIPEVSI